LNRKGVLIVSIKLFLLYKIVKMGSPKGKLVIIGGSVDRGSFSESPDDLQRNLKFFEKGILKRITTESKQ
jgi:hypothetical protein